MARIRAQTAAAGIDPPAATGADDPDLRVVTGDKALSGVEYLLIDRAESLAGPVGAGDTGRAAVAAPWMGVAGERCPADGAPATSNPLTHSLIVDRVDVGPFGFRQSAGSCEGGNNVAPVANRVEPGPFA